LAVVYLIYLTASRLYHRRVGVLAAAFYACAVLPIQQSHFFTVDTFTNFFVFLAIYFAVQVSDASVRPAMQTGSESENPAVPEAAARFWSHSVFWPAILFGLALGMAVASKINAVAVVVVLPGAALLYWLRLSPAESVKQFVRIFAYLVLAGLVSLLAFRIFQPYAFSGPGFFGLKPNSLWVENMKSLRAQTGGDVDFPPALQWARRPLWFSLQNLVLWGLGLPLGVLAWVGFVWMGWRMLKGEWRRHALLWGWTAIYFTWQSLQWNSTMRYQLPIYPALAIFAAWAVFRLECLAVARSVGGKKVSDISFHPLCGGTTRSNESSQYFGVARAGLMTVLVDDSVSYPNALGHAKRRHASRRPVTAKGEKAKGLNVKRIGVYLFGFAVLVATFIWAFSFASIYPRPHTRVAATRWMFQNFPGPITLHIQTDDGQVSELVPYSDGSSVSSAVPHTASFVAKNDGLLTEVYLPHVVGHSLSGNLLVRVALSPQDEQSLAMMTLSANQLSTAPADADDRASSFDRPVALVSDETYYLIFETVAGLGQSDLCAPLRLRLQAADDDIIEQEIQPVSDDCVARTDRPYSVAFTPEIGAEATLAGLVLPQVVVDQPPVVGEQVLSVALSTQSEGEPAATASVLADFDSQADPRGEAYTLSLDQAVEVKKDETYYLKFELQGQGELAFSGSALANESGWDDGLPLRMEGYDPFGGIYQGGLNFEMYWDDNAEKLERFTHTLAQADYLLITSSRQWATTTRVPERYPLTSRYYRHLLGCPETLSIERCYTVARPGDYRGDLGFELVKVFQSNPSIGSFEINDQFAEEAFTVYDHPKVLIFQKTDDYDPAAVEEILGAVDLSAVVHVTPRKADSHSKSQFQSQSKNLMLPSDRLIEQREGGTWSDFFDYDAPQNRWQILGVGLWYASVFLVGLIIYPLVRFAMPGLPDRGYPLARIAGLLLLAWMVWFAGSARIPFNRLTIGTALLLMVAAGAILAYVQRDGLLDEWQRKRKYFLIVEGLFLAFFIVGLLIRFGNPDLWHPWKGGEKPMDFSYFNAVLKSTTFPPYDPWFARGYINYYYYGFMVVGVLVKFLGIVPSFAYNLILPTLFAMIAMGAFSIVWNLGGRNRDDDGLLSAGMTRSRQLISAIGGAFGMAVLGNLGVMRMIFTGYQQIAVSSAKLAEAGLIRKFIWTIAGMIKSLTGIPLPYRMDEWYWNPSRVIGAEHGSPITEFPFFTFLYGDLHAHLIALPIALFGLAWMLSLSLRRGANRWRPLQILISLFLGALAVGALFPTNTWDYYTYLILGCVGIIYAFLHWQRDADGLQSAWKTVQPLLWTLGSIGVFVLLSICLYQPYRHWYGQGYNQIDIWSGTHTPSLDYLTHWGLFLFLIVTWMFSESIDWMAHTPVSALRKLEKHSILIIGALIILVTLMAALGVGFELGGEAVENIPLGLGVHIVWWLLPLAAWAGVLLLRPGQPEAKRAVLFLIGTALVLTLAVEVIVLRGDLGRMNTVFKFYLQAWTLLAISAAAALGWLLGFIRRWDPRWRLVWQIVSICLIAGAALYPLMGSFAKIEDRMAADAPHTLDGMTYMQHATYVDEGAELDLSQDYDAIIWMQENVAGSPVIVEANQVEYHWGTRYTIYTGLPGVLGWNWHQRQQRTLTPHDWIYERLDGIEELYLTEDIEQARDFLIKYDVRYIVLGQFERTKYPGPGLDKFSVYNGDLWNDVYQDGDTVIYEVNGN
ncbi:MAG: DUF2298 domain-containing protein, partial [Chloroflexota bacterium]|nr:DUF2298 domain-containing protein [Chloroflexota bacterium]